MKFQDPLPGRPWGDKYGPRGNVPGVGNVGFHTGADKPAPRGTPMLAMAPGRIKAKWFDRFASGAPAGGYMVSIDHGEGWESRYAHMDKHSWRAIGERVTYGSFIGHVGSSGAANGPHAHIELWHSGQHVDPLKYIGKKEDELTKEDIAKIVSALLDEPIKREGVDKHGKPRKGTITLRKIAATWEHQIGIDRRKIEDLHEGKAPK